MDDAVRQLQRRVDQLEKRAVHVRFGKITQVAPNLSVRLGASDQDYQNVSAVGGSTLDEDDKVPVLKYGNDMLVLGGMGDGGGGGGGGPFQPLDNELTTLSGMSSAAATSLEAIQASVVENFLAAVDDAAARAALGISGGGPFVNVLDDPTVVANATDPTVGNPSGTGTDNAAALQAIIDNAANTETIYFGPGSYGIKATLRIPSNRHILFHPRARLLALDTMQTMINNKSGPANPNKDITIEGGELDGNGACFMGKLTSGTNTITNVTMLDDEAITNIPVGAMINDSTNLLPNGAAVTARTGTTITFSGGNASGTTSTSTRGFTASNVTNVAIQFIAPYDDLNIRPRVMNMHIHDTNGSAVTFNNCVEASLDVLISHGFGNNAVFAFNENDRISYSNIWAYNCGDDCINLASVISAPSINNAVYGDNTPAAVASLGYDPCAHDFTVDNCILGFGGGENEGGSAFALYGASRGSINNVVIQNTTGNGMVISNCDHGRVAAVQNAAKNGPFTATHSGTTLSSISPALSTLTPQIMVGASITGSGVPANTFVSAVNVGANTLTLTRAATGTGPYTTIDCYSIPCENVEFSNITIKGAGSQYTRASTVPGNPQSGMLITAFEYNQANVQRLTFSNVVVENPKAAGFRLKPRFLAGTNAGLTGQMQQLQFNNCVVIYPGSQGSAPAYMNTDGSGWMVDYSENGAVIELGISRSIVRNAPGRGVEVDASVNADDSAGRVQLSDLVVVNSGNLTQPGTPLVTTPGCEGIYLAEVVDASVRGCTSTDTRTGTGKTQTVGVKCVDINGTLLILGNITTVGSTVGNMNSHGIQVVNAAGDWSPPQWFECRSNPGIPDLAIYDRLDCIVNSTAGGTVTLPPGMPPLVTVTGSGTIEGIVNDVPSPAHPGYNGYVGQQVIFTANTTPKFTDAPADSNLQTSGVVSLGSSDTVMFVSNGVSWLQVATSNN